MRHRLQLLFSILFVISIYFFSAKNVLAANYTFNVSNYHLDTSSNEITFTGSDPSMNFDDTDRIDIYVTSSAYDITDSAVLYKSVWPNNSDCTFGQPGNFNNTGYYCTNNVLSAVNPDQNGGLYICLHSEFDGNTYCSQEIESLDLFANVSLSTMTVSNYHLNTSNNEITFTSSSPSALFDDTDRMDIYLTNSPITTDPIATVPSDTLYSSLWPNNPNCEYGQPGNENNTGYYCSNEVLNSTSYTPSSNVYLCLYSYFDTRIYCSQAISYFDLISNIPLITYFNANNGTNFSRSTSPFTSGVSTQSEISNGTVTVNVNDTSGYADSGFDIYEGTLANLPNFTVNGSGDQFGLNIWLGTGNTGDFFAWNSDGNMTSLNGDTYALGPASTSGTDAITGSSQFYLMSNGQNYSLDDLRNGDVSGINPDIKVAVWVGVNTSSGSTSSTISSISGL